MRETRPTRRAFMFLSDRTLAPLRGDYWNQRVTELQVQRERLKCIDNGMKRFIDTNDEVSRSLTAKRCTAGLGDSWRVGGIEYNNTSDSLLFCL